MAEGLLAAGDVLRKRVAGVIDSLGAVGAIKNAAEVLAERELRHRVLENRLASMMRAHQVIGATAVTGPELLYVPDYTILGANTG